MIADNDWLWWGCDTGGRGGGERGGGGEGSDDGNYLRGGLHSVITFIPILSCHKVFHITVW